MTRSVLWAVVLGGAVLAASWLLYRTVVVGADVPAVVVHVDAGPRSAQLDDAGVVDAGVADADGHVGDATRAIVLRAKGAVQARTGAGAWRDVVQGTVLSPDDVVRTGRDAETTLRVGTGVEVKLAPRSSFTIRDLRDDLSRIRLESGQVSASVDEHGARVLRVEARGSDAVAESAGGAFGVVSDGAGQLAVATTTGTVKLTAAGQTTLVPAGMVSIARPGVAPSAAAAVTASLFVRVAEPSTTRTNQLSTLVSGQAEPGALVRVGELTVLVDDAGHFSLKVPLQDGKNTLALDVADATGRSKHVALPDVTVDRSKPRIDAAVEWGQPAQ